MANNFINKKVDLTTTDLTTLYTVPTAKTAVVKSIFSLFKTKSISSNTTVELLTQPLVVEESEAIKVQASDANELHVIASILEIQPREVTT
jgi:hypothetical protein